MRMILSAPAGDKRCRCGSGIPSLGRKKTKRPLAILSNQSFNHNSPHGKRQQHCQTFPRWGESQPHGSASLAPLTSTLREPLPPGRHRHLALQTLPLNPTTLAHQTCSASLCNSGPCSHIPSCLAAQRCTRQSQNSQATKKFRRGSQRCTQRKRSLTHSLARTPSADSHRNGKENVSSARISELSLAARP